MPVMIEAQRASILVPHDHRHISHVRMLLAWIWVLASRSSKAESRRPDAYSFDYCGRKEDQRAATEPRHTAMSGAPALGRISVPGGGGGGLKRSDFVM